MSGIEAKARRKAQRQALRDRQICVSCCKAPAFPNRIRCAPCAAKQALQQATKRRDNPSLCSQCLIQTKREGKQTCGACAARRKKERRGQRKELNQYYKTYRKAYLDAGICTDCKTQSALPNRIRCAECAAAQALYIKKRRLAAPDLCTRCGHQAKVLGKSLCEPCAVLSSAYFAKIRKQRIAEALCSQCGGEREYEREGKRCCVKCAALANRRRRERRKEEEETSTAGLE